MKHSEYANPERQKTDQQLQGAMEKGEWRVTANGNEVSFGGNENIPELYRCDYL